MSPRATSARALRTLARQLSSEPPGRLYSLGGTDRHPTATPELVVEEPDDLIGVVADPAWRGIALVLGGRASCPDAAVSEHRPVTLAVVMDRTGRCASAIRHHGAPPAVTEIDGLSSVSGYVVDLASRIVGLDTPPERCTSTHLFLAAWLRNVLDRVADPATSPSVSGWCDVVDCHPAVPPSRRLADVLPAIDDDPLSLADLTLAAADHLTWPRLHRLASMGTIRVPGLSASDAAWMDWPAFARWALDVHRPVDELLDDLSLFLDGPLLADIREVVHAVILADLPDRRAS